MLDNIIHKNFYVEEWSPIRYIEIGVRDFIELLSDYNTKFFDMNPNALYILKDGNFTGFKYILSKTYGRIWSELRKRQRSKNPFSKSLIIEIIILLNGYV